MATAIASSCADRCDKQVKYSLKNIPTHKIITGCCESLDYCHLVSEFPRTWSFSSGEKVYEEKCRVPHDDEIENLRNEHPKNRSQVMYDAMTLIGKEKEDGVQ